MSAQINLDYAVIFNAASNGMAITEYGSGIIVDVNHEWLSATGIDRQQAIGKTFLELDLWENKSDREACLAQFEQNHKLVEFETRLLMKSVVSTHLISAHIVEMQGKHYVLWELRNISQRKKNEKNLRESEILLRSTLESTDEGILMIGSDGRVLSANHRFMELWHVPQTLIELKRDDLLIAHVLDQLVDPEDFVGLVQKLYSSDEEARDTLQFKDGRVFSRFTRTLKIDQERGRIWCFKDITAQSHAEALLAESNALLRAIINTAPVRIFWKDNDLRYLGCNNLFAQDAGKSSPEELLGKDDYQMPWAEQAELYRADDRAVMTSGTSKLSFDEPQSTPDGRTIWLRTSKVPLQNDVNEIIGILGTYEDVTERKCAELRLLQSRAELQEAQRIAHMGNWQVDFSTNHVYWSEELYRMQGLEPGSTPPDYTESAKLFTPQSWECLSTAIARVAETGISYELELEMVKSDGSHGWMLAHGEAVRDSNNAIIGVRGVAVDITKRKNIEIELKIAAAAFDTCDAIVITDKDANIIRVNQAFSEITGYSAEEVLGANPRMMSSGRHDRSFYIEMWQQLQHTGHWAGEIYDRRKNGEVYPKWLTITAVRNECQEATHYVAIFSDITVRKRIEDEIHKLAFYDPLTKLPNRRLFLDRLRAALAASARRNDFGAVLFIDLDRFKALNDTLGHDYGDMLLIEVGERIKSCVREMDTVARFGGDEFVVLIEDFSDNRDEATRKIAQIAEKVREALAKPYKLKEHEYHCSPSIGISVFHGNDEPLDVLIEHADMAMYQVKNSGRNGLRFFDPVMQHNVATHDALENDLHYAIELQQLHLHYQIQVDNDNQPLGAEAFLRWEHPERGMIMPGQMIPIAEESNLIIDIGHWVLETACAQLALWSKRAITRDLTLTVNISAKQFARPDFVEEVADILKAQQVDPIHLKLELSERLVLTDMKSTKEKIYALRNLGVRLSMDNFGTVYSSLSYLKQLSSDQLKIHQDFVHGITQEGNDAQLVQTVIDLAKSLDMNVFAEGVETEEQRAFLKKHDCNIYQGYLFGKPVAIDEFEELILRL